jgi:hypothetical protein
VSGTETAVSFLMPNQSFPFYLERHATRLSATMDLPPPNSGRTFLRLMRFPKNGRYTILDLTTYGQKFELLITRFLKPLQREILKGFESGDENLSMVKSWPIEISSMRMGFDDGLAFALQTEDYEQFEDGLSESVDADHYFLFFTDSNEFVCKAVSNPVRDPRFENWVRIINRSYGLELSPPRRLMYEAVEEKAF